MWRQVRIELTNNGLLAELTNRYTTQDDFKNEYCFNSVQSDRLDANDEIYHKTPYNWHPVRIKLARNDHLALHIIHSTSSKCYASKVL